MFAPENRTLNPIGKDHLPKHPFSGVNSLLVSGGVNPIHKGNQGITIYHQEMYIYIYNVFSSDWIYQDTHDITFTKVPWCGRTITPSRLWTFKFLHLLVDSRRHICCWRRKRFGKTWEVSQLALACCNMLRMVDVWWCVCSFWLKSLVKVDLYWNQSGESMNYVDIALYENWLHMYVYIYKL